MGNETQPDKRPLAALEALAGEQPTQLIARLRAVWPQVQQALKAGHTLRQVHKRLNVAGVPIGYKVLVVYRTRIERGKNQSSIAGYAVGSQIARQRTTSLRSPGQFSRAGTETGGLAISVGLSR
jgi:hypothetical protein